MTPAMLINDLANDLQALFTGKTFKLANGESGALNIYQQHIPIAAFGGDEDACYPYLMIKLEQHSQLDATGPTECQVTVFAGIFDDNEDLQGYKDLMNIMEDIRQHFLGQGVIAGKYRLTYPLAVVYSEDDYYPYFVAALECHWLLPGLASDKEARNL